MVKGVIFDLDGTLIDTLFELANAANYALTQWGFPTHTIEEYRGFVGNGVTKIVERALPEGKKDLTMAVREKFYEYYEAHILDTVPIYDGMAKLVAELGRRGIPMCVNTNKIDAFAKKLANYAFPGAFIEVLGECDRFPKKSAPDAALYLCEKMGINSSECLFVGDSGVDIKTADNAKMPKIIVTWGFVYKSELEKLCDGPFADSADDILKMVESL
ncbi:MAG: HAD-IA family hydrolase [Clostridia bacterium]|nr:HAD-IA family hydrolase [Clostridia bacterium]